MAPSNVKIDGLAAEWNDKFQAYNKSTNIFYIISNNDSFLYLTLQAKDPLIIAKIVEGGITLTINNFTKKIDKNNISITFPVYDKENKSLHLILNNKPPPTNDTLKNRMQSDSFLNAKNQQLKGHLKLVGLSGVKLIPDGNISIYNQEGLEAASRLDDKLIYTLELMIPLKYLGDISNKFNYNIKLNGVIAASGGQILDTGRDDIISFRGADGKDYTMGRTTPENMIMAYATDFWGEYTLAKK